MTDKSTLLRSLLKADSMESVNLEMEDIFDEPAEEDDFPTVRALPDLPDGNDFEGKGNGDEDENSAEVLSRLKDLSKGAAKKVVRKPQPKLDATSFFKNLKKWIVHYSNYAKPAALAMWLPHVPTIFFVVSGLTGERGIPILPKMFQDVKFKGKGHEAQDLQIMMRYLEHWAHRLFPKMPFDEVLERIEKLGTKNEVKTCIKKMRLDMPVLHEDYDVNDGDEDADGEEKRTAENDVDMDAEEAFDELLRAETESGRGTKRDSPSKPKTSPPKHTSHLATQLALPLSQNPSDPQSDVTPKGLTSEQRDRIERNKRIAMEKRLAKQGGTFKIPAPPSPRTPGKQTPPYVSSSPQSPIPLVNLSPGRSGQGSLPPSSMTSHTSSSPRHYHGSIMHSSLHGQHAINGMDQTGLPHRQSANGGIDQTTFRTLLQNQSSESNTEMNDVFSVMNGHQGTSIGHFSGQENINYVQGFSQENSINPNGSQQMSEVFPPPQSCNGEGVSLVSVNSKVYADLSSPKKTKLDTSLSSGQLSEEELMLHLSESD